MSRAKVEANNERKKNYKEYNKQAKRKKFTIYIPVIIVALVLVGFIVAAIYAGSTANKANTASYTAVNLDAITDYTQELQSQYMTE